MPKVTPLSYEERQTIEELKSSPMTIREIGRVLGRFHYIVNKEFTLEGGREFYNAKKAHEASLERAKKRSQSARRHKAPRRELTLEDRKIIEKYKISDLSGDEIAKLIGRHKNTINKEFRISGGRESYDAEKAQKEFETVKGAKFEIMKKPIEEGGFTISPKVLHPNMQKDLTKDFIDAVQNKENRQMSSHKEYESNIPRLPLKVWVDRFREEFSESRPYWSREVRYFEFWVVHLGDWIAVDIDPIVIEEVSEKILKTKHSKNEGSLSESTRVKFLMYLSSLYTVAIREWKWAIFNPVSCVKKRPRASRYSPNTDEDKSKINQFKKESVDIIKRKLVEMNLTRDQAAKKCGVSRHCFQNVLSEDQNTLLKNFIMVCDGFGIKVMVQEMPSEDSELP